MITKIVSVVCIFLVLAVSISYAGNWYGCLMQGQNFHDHCVNKFNFDRALNDLIFMTGISR